MDNRYNKAMTENLTLSHAKQKPEPAIRVYLGGSFDPVHNAHIQMAMHVYNALLPLASHQRKLHVSLLPNARSPFKDDSTAPEHRLNLLALATQDTPLEVSELELWQTPPVYTIDSVRTLRQRYPKDTLIFVIGMDSARDLDKWKDGLQLTDYVHLWVFDRNEKVDIPQVRTLTDTSDLSKTRENVLANQHIANEDVLNKGMSKLRMQVLIHELPLPLQSQVTDSYTDLVAFTNNTDHSPLPLKKATLGRIYIDSRPIAAISSTQIRQLIKSKLFNASRSPDSVANILNPVVYHYIIAHQLYSAV